MNSASHTSVKTWVRFNTTRKHSFKENRQKKTKPNQNHSSNLHVPSWTPLNCLLILYLLNHVGVCLGYLCLFAIPPACRNWTRLLVGPWKMWSAVDTSSPTAQQSARSALVFPGLSLHQRGAGSRYKGPETNLLIARSLLPPCFQRPEHCWVSKSFQIKTIPRVVPAGYGTGRSRSSGAQETLRPRSLFSSQHISQAFINFSPH